MLTFNFDPFPELLAGRLLLRRMTAADMDDLFDMRSNLDIMQYIARPLAETPADALKLIANIDEGIADSELINWGITLRDQNRVIGTIGFYRMKPEHHRAEVGYLLHSSFQNKGYMQEALEAVIEFGFKEMKLHSIEAVIDPRNARSEKILVKNDFVKEAYFKENVYFEGKFLDSVHYSLLNNRI